MGCNRNNHNNDNNNNDVAGVFYPHRNRVRATIDFDDLCRAVRHCLDNDLGGVQDDESDDDRDRCRKHDRFF